MASSSSSPALSYASFPAQLGGVKFRVTNTGELFWLKYLISIYKTLYRELFNDEADEAPFDEDEEICDVEPERYVNVFANIKDVLTKSERFATRYKAFVDEFFKNESKDYVD